MKTIEVRGLALGGGRPKICAPLVAGDLEGLELELERGSGLPVDLWEWRVDYFHQAAEPRQVVQAAGTLRDRLGSKPLLFTFRRRAEGGVRDCPEPYYFELIRRVIQSGQVDLVDMELFSNEDGLKRTLAQARKHGTKVIVSNHDFQATPASRVLTARLLRMKSLGADLGKIAVWPRSPADVLRLLAVTNEIRTSCPGWPIITIAMGGLGLISRLSGEFFGSALTFGSAGPVSAPGQLPADELARILDLLHIRSQGD